MQGCRGYRPRTLYQLDWKDAGGRQGDRHAVARLGGHGGLCGAHDGQDVGRRVPAHHDRTGVGAGYADYPARRTHLVSKMFTLPINAITALLGIPIVVWVVLRNKSVTA